MRVALGFVLLLTGCATTTPPMVGVPTAIDRSEIRPVAAWAGTPVLVEEGRPTPAQALRVAFFDRGLTWESYSATLVQETQRALLDALGPARADAAVELRVIIREHSVRFEGPNWIGSTVLEADVLRAGQPTAQRWLARGNQVRWNWMGMGTAVSANQAAYTSAVQDLLRQLALSRPPQ